MKFLIDNQLPPALARFFEIRGHEARHVREVRLNWAGDDEVWKHAGANGFVVVSKDEDFSYFASAPNPTAKLIWVRIGNCRTTFLLGRFDSSLPQIIDVLEGGAHLVELR